MRRGTTISLTSSIACVGLAVAALAVFYFVPLGLMAACINLGWHA